MSPQEPWYLRLWRFLLESKIKQDLGPKAVAVSVPIVATGYATPQPPVGVKESRNLDDCEPDLVSRYAKVKEEFRALTGMDLFETTTWRSKERQAELYAQGRTSPGQIVTNIDGVKSRSRHNFYPSQAIDVCVDSDPGPGKVAVWDSKLYAPLGPLCVKHGLVWGGNFKHLPDYPHLEMA